LKDFDYDRNGVLDLNELKPLVNKVMNDMVNTSQVSMPEAEVNYITEQVF
jgi:hypothetical protein